MEKLLASADDLVMNGEFEPQDVYSMTKELEQRMTVFLQRVEKRKSILDLSVLFHTHVVEVIQIDHIEKRKKKKLIHKF